MYTTTLCKHYLMPTQTFSLNSHSLYYIYFTVSYKYVIVYTYTVVIARNSISSIMLLIGLQMLLMARYNYMCFSINYAKSLT